MKISTTTVTSVGLCLLALTVGTYSIAYDPAFIQDANPTFLCVPKNVSDVSGVVYSHLNVEHSPYLKGMDCAITLNTKPGKRINIRFDYFDLAPAWDSTINQCRIDGTPPTDSFRIYESGKINMIRGDVLQPDVTLCGGTGKFPSDYQSSSNVVTVRFTTDDIVTADAGIKFVYTSFTPPGDGTSDCFKCDDGTMCIDQSLICNGMPNCNDDSDESKSRCADDDNIFTKGLETLGLGVVAVIGAAIGLVFLITIILCIVCCCCCGKNNDSNQKQYRAPPTPRPGSYPSHASNYSSYSSSASTTAGRPPYPMHYPPAYPPIQNGGYAVAYNQTNGRMEFPHKV